MSKLLFAFGLASALMFGLATQAATPNFAGTWTLDKSKSEGLSPAYKIFELTLWVITQTDKEISIQETHRGPAGPAPPPGRLNTGGGDRSLGPRTYNLDGSESTVDLGRTKFVRKAILSSDGKTLELVQKTISLRAEREVTYTLSDKLSLSADGNVLTVIRHNTGLGPPDSTLVFNK